MFPSLQCDLQNQTAYEDTSWVVFKQGVPNKYLILKTKNTLIIFWQIGKHKNGNTGVLFLSVPTINVVPAINLTKSLTANFNCTILNKPLLAIHSKLGKIYLS